jgi:hypothetical protein
MIRTSLRNALKKSQPPCTKPNTSSPKPNTRKKILSGKTHLPEIVPRKIIAAPENEIQGPSQVGSLDLLSSED